MTENNIALTRDQFAELRGKGQTFAGYDYDQYGIRLVREGGGYGPLPGATNQVLLTDDDLDLIEAEPEGLVAADTLGENGWRITVQGVQVPR